MKLKRFLTISGEFGLNTAFHKAKEEAENYAFYNSEANKEEREKWEDVYDIEIKFISATMSRERYDEDPVIHYNFEIEGEHDPWRYK